MANTVYLEGEGIDEKRGKQLYQGLRRAVSALPGVESVALAFGLPLLDASQVPVQLPARVKTVSIGHTVVDTEYFSTLGLRILAGRAFTSADGENSPLVTVINHKMAEMFWPGQDPVGKVFRADDPPHQFTVVGVAADGKYLDLDESPQPFFCYALAQHYRGAISVIARTREDPRLWVQPLARALRGLGLKLLIEPVTLDRWMTITLLRRRIASGCVAFLSALALLLAVIGLFGALSYSVNERKKELGIRVALGAERGHLLMLVLRQTAFIARTGIAVGTLLGVAATLVFRSELYAVSAVEWSVLLPVAIAMFVLALAVAALSGRPWLAIDPMEAVRHA